MTKKLLMILSSIILLLVLSSCGNNGNNTKFKGSVIIKSYDEIVEMKKSNDEFIVVFTLDECPHCDNLNKMFKSYLVKHDIIINEVILDLEFTPENITKNVSKEFPKLNHSPTIYYVKDNNVLDEFKYKEDNNLESSFDDWIKQLDF